MLIRLNLFWLPSGGLLIDFLNHSQTLRCHFEYKYHFEKHSDYRAGYSIFFSECSPCKQINE